MLKTVSLVTALTFVVGAFGFSAIKWGGAGLAEASEIMTQAPDDGSTLGFEQGKKKTKNKKNTKRGRK